MITRKYFQRMVGGEDRGGGRERKKEKEV